MPGSEGLAPVFGAMLIGEAGPTVSETGRRGWQRCRWGTSEPGPRTLAPSHSVNVVFGGEGRSGSASSE